MRVLDLFSGCGGFSKGFREAGFETIAFVEWWRPAAATFLHNHPHALHLGIDITQIPDEKIQQLKGKVEIVVGSPPCTRFSRHLYVRQNGIVHPCVGAPGVVLGDVKKQSLQEVWESEVMKIIRDHKYIGPCTSCKNFQEEECYSCLGRRAPNLTTEKIVKWGAVPLESTCFNFRDYKK